MATIQKFEDLICWQKARELTREVYRSLNIEIFKSLNELAIDCSRLIHSFIQKLKVSPHDGLQYKKVEKKMSDEDREFDKYLNEMMKKATEDAVKKMNL